MAQVIITSPFCQFTIRKLKKKNRPNGVIGGGVVTIGVFITKFPLTRGGYLTLGNSGYWKEVAKCIHLPVMDR